MRIGDKVRKYRTLAGLTTAELGKKVGFSHRDIGEYIRAYEAGKVKPCRATRERLAKALDLPERRMLDREIETEADIDFILEELIQDDGFSVEVIQKHIDRFADRSKRSKTVTMDVECLQQIYETLNVVQCNMALLLKFLDNIAKSQSKKKKEHAKVFKEVFGFTSMTASNLCSVLLYFDDLLQSKGKVVL